MRLSIYHSLGSAYVKMRCWPRAKFRLLPAHDLETGMMLCFVPGQLSSGIASLFLVMTPAVMFVITTVSKWFGSRRVVQNTSKFEEVICRLRADIELKRKKNHLHGSLWQHVMKNFSSSKILFKNYPISIKYFQWADHWSKLHVCTILPELLYILLLLDFRFNAPRTLTREPGISVFHLSHLPGGGDRTLSLPPWVRWWMGGRVGDYCPWNEKDKCLLDISGISCRFCCYYLFSFIYFVLLFWVKTEGTAEDQTDRMWMAGPAESPVQR